MSEKSSKHIKYNNFIQTNPNEMDMGKSIIITSKSENLIFGPVTWRHTVATILMLVGCFAVLLIYDRIGNGRHYIASGIEIAISIVGFLLLYRGRKPYVREVAAIGVLVFIGVLARLIFGMIPHFKPMCGIVMIGGMALSGPGGFLLGTLTAFCSNILFGQGQWTPWQMFAYGVAGFLAGWLYRLRIVGKKHLIGSAIVCGFLVVAVIGPILDISTIFSAEMGFAPEIFAMYFKSGLPVNIIHASCTVLTVLVMTRPLLNRLDRMRVKYGMFGGYTS